MSSNQPWLQPAASVGALDGVAEAPLAGTEELFAALEEERDRRGITRHYQSAECGYNIIGVLRGDHKTFDEDDWAFLRQYITCSRSKKSVEQLKADYEEANKDKKPDWVTCGPAKKSEVIERALERYAANGVNLYALGRSSPELADIADLFENCNLNKVRCFITDKVDLLRMAGANPPELETQLQAARGRRGDEPKVEYRGPILDAVGAVFKTGGDDDFNAAREANTLRLRTLEVSRVVAERRDDTQRQLDALKELLQAEEESFSENSKPSVAEVTADVRALAAETAVELSVEARPQFAARRLEGGVWSAWDPCGTIREVQNSLGLSENNLVRGLLGLYPPLSKKNAYLRNICEVEPYNEAEHGTYDAARVAARFDNGSAFSSVEAALASDSLDDPSDVLIMKRKGSNHRPWSELPETKAGIDARIADSQRCVAIFDVAHCKSFFADVSKAEVAVDAFAASGTA